MVIMITFNDIACYFSVCVPSSSESGRLKSLKKMLTHLKCVWAQLKLNLAHLNDEIV